MREEGGRYNYGRRLPVRERGERESPAHSGKTIQLVSEGRHSTQRERERKRGKKKREREELLRLG